MKTLRVELADLEGIPHGGGRSNTTVTVTARYTGPVVLEADGRIIPPIAKADTMGPVGRVDFTVYTSDSPDVREDHRGFAIEVHAKVTEPSGRSYTYTRTVKPLEHMANIIRLGRLPAAEGLPAKWVTVDELIAALEGAEVGWAEVTDKPTAFPPSAHVHTAAEVGAVPADDPRLRDTGWRSLPLSPDVTWGEPSGRLLLRRVNERVYLQADRLRIAEDSTSSVTVFSSTTDTELPVGFRPSGVHISGFFTQVGSPSRRYNVCLWSRSNFNVYSMTNITSGSANQSTGWSASHALVGELMWVTDESWPTTLPGTPA